MASIEAHQNHEEENCDTGCDKNSDEELNVNLQEDIRQSVEKYLDSLNHSSEPVNPRIRKKQKQLEELLESYKRLCDLLDSKYNTEREVKTRLVTPVSPEIHALLHPELYKNIRDEEKDRLIKKFSTKRIFTDVERVIPPPTNVTPTYTIADIRQSEKERFCRLIASAPSRFHNVLEGSSGSTPKRKIKKFTSYTPAPQENIRESEKERLARIFATSAVFLKNPNLQKRILNKNLHNSIPSSSKASNSKPDEVDSKNERKNRLCNGNHGAKVNLYNSISPSSSKTSNSKPDEVDSSNNERKNRLCNGNHGAKEVKSDMCKKTNVVNQENINPQFGKDPNEMVRMGEYSPLNKNYYSRGRTVLGVGEHDERKRMLDAERHGEYVEHLADLAKVAQDKKDKAIMVREEEVREQMERELNTRVSSASTQTDDYLQEDSYHKHKPMSPSPSTSPKKSIPVQGYSPRQKLISDLYGDPYFNSDYPSGNPHQEEKRKQIEYAEALKQQIAEKKRLDDERKRREREDEDMIDKRVQEQSKRMEQRYVIEQHQKMDWIQQRQAQEEILRRKLLEMNLEAKELKKQERLRRSTQVEKKPAPVVLPHHSPPRRNNRPRPANSPQEARMALRDFEERPIKPRLKENPMTLPEQLPAGNWEERPEKYIENLQGVDLLREYRGQKELLQLPPITDRMSARSFHSDKSGPSAEDLLRAPLDGYIPSGEDERRRSKSVNSYRRKAEDILKAPLDPLISPSPEPKPRPPSPVIPAVRTETLLKNNSRILHDKWQVPPQRGVELERTVNSENILSQLGAFRRQLAREHQRLEQRLEQRS